MPMPVAPMQEDGALSPDEGEIGLAQNVVSVFAATVPEIPDKTPETQLRFGVT